MNFSEPLLQRIGILPEERGLFGWAVLCLVLLGAAAVALQNAAETLFLKRVGVEALPWALLVSSGLLVLTTGSGGRVASADPARWLPRVLVALGLAPVPFVTAGAAFQPNRTPCQQRQARAAPSSTPRTRSLRFEYAGTRRPRPRGIA